MEIKKFIALFAWLILFMPAQSQNNCLSFSGGNGENVNMGVLPEMDNLSTFTLEMWVNISTINNKDCFFSKNLGGNTDWFMFTMDGGGSPNNLKVQLGSQSQVAKTTSTPLYAGEWFHLAFVYDGTQAINTDRIQIYINGLRDSLEFGSTALPTSIPVSTAPVILGKKSDGSSSNEQYRGFLDDVVFWDTVRTETQVQLDMGTHFNGTEPNLIAYLPMDGSGTDTTATDLTGQHDGTLYSFATPPPDYWVSRSVEVPSTQATNIAASNIFSSQMDLTWDNGSGSGRVVFMDSTTTGTPVLTDSTTYTASAIFGSGQQSGNWFCVYNGTGSSVKVSGLSASTDYRVMVCEYNGTSGYEKYNTTTGTNNPNNFATNTTPANITEPTVQANSVLCMPYATSCDISWVNGDGIQRLVFVKQTDQLDTPAPADASSYSANSVFAAGSQINTDGWYCVYNGTQQSVRVSGLSTNTSYRVMVLEYNGTAEQENYLTSTVTDNPKSFITGGTYYWTGSSDNNWSTASNWEHNAVPESTQDIYLKNGLTNYPVVAENVTARCKNLTIENQASLTVNSNGSNSGALIPEGLVTGEIIYKRWLSADTWHIIAPPVENQDIQQLLTNPNNSVAFKDPSYGVSTYDEATNSWNSYFNASTTGNFMSGVGYLMRRQTSDGYIDFIGTVPNSDDTITLHKSGDPGEGWNCIGNPFPSALNATSTAHASDNLLSLNAGVLDPSYTALYIWDEQASYAGVRNDYKIINHTDGGTLGQHYVQSGQGFIVKAANNGSSFHINTNMRSGQSSVPLKSGAMPWADLSLSVKSGEEVAQTRLKFNNDMTDGLDIGYDAGLMRSGNQLNIFTQLVKDNGVDFALQCLSESGMEEVEIPIGVESTSGGTVEFTVQKNNFPIELVPVLSDRLTNTQFAFTSDNQVYNTSITEDEDKYGRFSLSFKSVLLSSDLLEQENKFKAWYKAGYFHISGEVKVATKVSVYDLNGRKFSEVQLTEQHINRFLAPSEARGIYLLRIESDATTSVLKVIKPE